MTQKTPVDTLEEIARKYSANLDRFFRVIVYEINQLKEKNYEVPEPILVHMGLRTLLSRDMNSMMISFLDDLRVNDCFDHILKRDLAFFEDHVENLIGANLPNELKTVCRSIFKLRTPEGHIPFSDETIDKIFKSFLSFARLSIKSTLVQSGIKSVKFDETKGYNVYELENHLIPDLDLSFLINQFGVTGVRIP